MFSRLIGKVCSWFADVCFLLVGYDNTCSWMVVRLELVSRFYHSSFQPLPTVQLEGEVFCCSQTRVSVGTDDCGAGPPGEGVWGGGVPE